MKKVLLTFDGIHFSEGAFEFARALNENATHFAYRYFPATD